MSTPPFRHLHGIAKYGTDEELLANRDNIRWMATWADEVHSELQSIWTCAEVAIAPTKWNNDADCETRDVSIRLHLADGEIETLLSLLSCKESQ